MMSTEKTSHTQAGVMAPACQVARSLHETVTQAFPCPTNWKKIQSTTQRPHKTVHDFHSQLMIVFWENSRLLARVNHTQPSLIQSLLGTR